ncbi:MAG: hypothetical protein JWQ60_6272 [Pseudonocardia sp.]|nr:hypothetical protein [Pseudonocardia sp.]
MSVAALTVLGLLINLISAAVSGTAFDGSAIIDLLIGALLAFGAVHIRLGHTWARPLNAGLAFVLTLVLMKVIAVLVVVFALYIGVSASGHAVGAPFPFLAAGVALIVSIGALGLIVAATVLMYRAPVNRYLATAVSYL